MGDDELRDMTMKNTKKEMLDAYREALRQLEETRAGELRPKEAGEEKERQKTLAAVDSLSSEGVTANIAALKSEISKTLSRISDQLEEQVQVYQKVQSAIQERERDLKDIYEIERAAGSLGALIEAHGVKSRRLEAETAARKEELEKEMLETRLKYQEEKDRLKAEADEIKISEAKRRKRDKEEYEYEFEREKRLARDRFEDEKAQAEKETQQKKAELEEREQELSRREEELSRLRRESEGFAKEKETAVQGAVKEASQRLQREAERSEEFLTKQFEGERNVFTTRISSLEQTIKEQSQRIAAMSQQLDKSYQQVEGIALKAVEGSSEVRSLSRLQQMASERERPSKDS